MLFAVCRFHVNTYAHCVGDGRDSAPVSHFTFPKAVAFQPGVVRVLDRLFVLRLGCPPPTFNYQCSIAKMHSHTVMLNSLAEMYGSRCHTCQNDDPEWLHDLLPMILPFFTHECLYNDRKMQVTSFPKSQVMSVNLTAGNMENSEFNPIRVLILNHSRPWWIEIDASVICAC